jgi:hypothetical protein
LPLIRPGRRNLKDLDSMIFSRHITGWPGW